MTNTNHPADETNADIRKHGWGPVFISAVLLALSILVDVLEPGQHWTQRAGAIVVVLGGYVAYRDATQSRKFIDDTLYVNLELPYRKISLWLVVIGTVIWGYGDLLL